MTHRSKRDTAQSHRETPETWWIEVKPTRFGFEAIGASSHGRILGASIDGLGAGPIWRPTQNWARRAALRLVRTYLQNRMLKERAEEQTQVYPVDL